MINDLENIYNNILNESLLLIESIEKTKVIEAIKDHDVVTIYYAGDTVNNEGYRTIEPFALGINKAGNTVLRAWQRSGASDTPQGSKQYDPLTRIPGWRMFRLDRIKSFTIQNDKFNVNIEFLNKERPKYNPNDKDMTSIYYSVTPLDSPKSSADKENTIKNYFDNIKTKFKRFFK
ncbi:MAG: WYL domain-containing protein [bacterium]